MLSAIHCLTSTRFFLPLSARRALGATAVLLFPRFPSPTSTMATAEPSPAMAILDKLIDHVSKLNVSSPSATQSAPASSSSNSASPTPAPSSSSSAASSFLSAHTVDVAWHPIIPVGHTLYTWVGDDNVPAAAAVAPSASPSPSTATPSAPSSAPSTAAPAAAPSVTAVEKPRAPAKEKKAAPAKAAAAKVEEAKSDQPDISRVDIRVGQVVKAWKHPEAEKLYVEEIDVGEDKPRQVVSGLVEFVPLDRFQTARLCVICNLKPSALRGVTSYGMVLAASNADRSVVELIAPPSSAPVGTRLSLSTVDVLVHQPDAVIDPKKKGNVWEKIKGGLKTDDQGRATFDGGVWRTPQGDCTSTLKNAQIS